MRTPPADAVELAALPDREPGREPPTGPDVWIAPGDLRYSFSRGGGPGGQAVNKLSTRVELRVPVAAIVGLDEAAAARLRGLAGRRLTRDDELVFHAQEHRSQIDNRRAALSRLQALVGEAFKTPKKRRPTRPSRAAVERRLEAKHEHAQKKERRRKTGTSDPDGIGTGSVTE